MPTVHVHSLEEAARLFQRDFGKTTEFTPMTLDPLKANAPTRRDAARRIMIVTDRYVPEISAAATRLHAHATRWISAGHSVDVVTCVPNFPAGKCFAGYTNGRHQVENQDGVSIHRVWSYMAPNSGKYRRSLDYLSFPISARLMAHKLPIPDVILASSPPITVALAGQWLARRFRRPWVFEVRDLWPASIRAVGAAKGGIIDLIERYELGLYRKAAATIVLTDAFFQDITNRGIPAEKLRVVTNGVDLEPFKRSPSKSEARLLLNVPQDKIVVGFVGTVGLAQGAGTFALAAGALKARPDILFMCWGEGADRRRVEAMVSEMGLSNIEFRNFLPQDQVPAILASLDVATVLLKNDPVFETVIPSKIFEILAAGRPVAACVSGEAKKLIDRSGGGLCVSPEDHEGLANVILQYVDKPRTALDKAAAGSAFIADAYSRDKLAADALDVLLEVIDRDTRAHASLR